MNELEISTIEMAKIVANPGQPRQVFDEEKLEDLATSLKNKGLLQPITVRPVNEHFEIVAGERRFRAAQLAEWDTIPCLVRELSDDEAYELAVLENAVREDLNPMEEAKMLETLLGKGMTLQGVGALVGIPTNQIGWRVSLLKLRDDIQYLVGRRQLKPMVAQYLARLSINGQARALHVWQEKGLGDDGVRGLTDAIYNEENQTDMFPETKISPKQQEAVSAYHRALELAAKAAVQLDQLDRETVVAGLATQMATATEYLDILIKNLVGMRRSLTAHRGRQLAAEM